jgi:hypothetical protein
MIAELSPGKRMAYVDEILPMLVFLSTRGAGWVNGQVIPVNGVRLKIVHSCKHQLIPFHTGLRRMNMSGYASYKFYDSPLVYWPANST